MVEITINHEKGWPDNWDLWLDVYHLLFFEREDDEGIERAFNLFLSIAMKARNGVKQTGKRRIAALCAMLLEDIGATAPTKREAIIKEFTDEYGHAMPLTKNDISDEDEKLGIWIPEVVNAV